MATIVIAIIIAVITSKTLKRKKVNKKIKSEIVKLIVVAGIFIGLYVPLSGYEDQWPIKEITPIQYDTGQFFKTRNSRIYYQYEARQKVARAGEEILLVEDDINSSIAKVIKIDEGEAKVILYRMKAKMSIWTFGLYYKDKYVIYDPINK